MRHPRAGKKVKLGPLELTAQPISGAGFHKGDYYWKRWLIEHKQTTKASISIKRKWWEKIMAEARMSGRLPMLWLTFDGPGFHWDLLCIDPRHLPRLMEDLNDAGDI